MNDSSLETRLTSLRALLDTASPRTTLSMVWTTLTLEDALTWVYDGPAINRIGLPQMREYFARSPLTVEWSIPLMDTGRDPEWLAFVSRAVGLSHDELMTKGLSMLLSHP